MAEQLIIAVFDSVGIGQKAGHDFNAISEKDEGFRIESCVLVQKNENADGRIIVLDTETRSFWGAVIGAQRSRLALRPGHAAIRRARKPLSRTDRRRSHRDPIRNDAG